MADRQETVADIIAEMKREAAKIFPALPIAVLQLATRIEAAHDHDIAIATEASARAVVGACVKQQEAERKCVALREALKRIVAASIIVKNTNAPEWILQRMADIFAMATTALAAAVREGGAK